MEKKINFLPNIDDDPEDLTRAQDFAEASLDHVVADAITSAAKYTGFLIAKSGPTTINVAPGRLYSAGKVYASEAAVTSDFIAQLPVAGKRLVAIVAWGQETDTDARPRNFVINVETRQAEPRVVPLVHARIANVNSVLGVEAPDPSAPLVDVGYTLLALVTLLPTGVGDIRMNAAAKLPNVDQVEGRVGDLEVFRARAGLQIETLASDLAGIKKQGDGRASAESVGRTLQRLAVLEAKSGVSSAALDSAARFYLTLADSEVADPNFLAKIEEGIRFAAEAENETALAIFNPLNPFAMIRGGVLFPAYDRTLAFTTGTPTSETQIATYSQTNHEMVQKTMSRQRIRYGEEFTVCTNSLWWKTGQYDVWSRTFRRDGEVFEVASTETFGRDLGNHQYMRFRKIWTDTVDEPYWDKITTTANVQGAYVSESWLQGQDMWLDAIGLRFTRLAAAGNATVAIVEVNDYGLPNNKAVIGSTTLQRADMQLAPASTVVGFSQPICLRAGKRYAVSVITAADHWVAMVAGSDFTSGTFFYILDGAYAQGDATRDLYLEVYRAKFRAQRTIIDLAGLSLNGGILAIDILANTIVPPSTTLSYEIQVGGIWYNLNDVATYILGQGGNIPPLLPLRAVFNGSVDMMPAVQLLDSRVRVSRPRTTFRAIDTTRTPPVPSSQIRVQTRLEYFDPAYHTSTVKLLTGVGFATEHAANSYSDDIDPADGALIRTYVFNLGAAVAAYRIDTRGTTTTAQKVFHVAVAKDWVL